MATPHTVQFDPSPSVINVLKQVGTDKAITAAGFARAVFRLHGEYAGDKAETLSLVETASMRKASEWLDETQALFDPSRIQSLSKSDRPPMVHGRLLVIGLSLLEPSLREQLESTGVFSALVKELDEPLSDILSDRGRALLESPERVEKRPDVTDSVPNWPDDPLLKPEEDLLGRRAFARFIAKRIDAIPRESGAYSIHIFGPWGAGKSTLLNFLCKELEPDAGGEWLVVEFNAWRQQQIQPPWWSLMERIFRRTRKSLNLWDRFQEYWWRFNTGRLQYVIGVIVLAWLLALFVFPMLRTQTADSSLLKTFGANAESISKVLALVATIWGGMVAANRSLLLGAARAAQNYADLTHDPTNEIKRRFNELIKKLSPARVAILIDDLDRCQSRYVVDLLEGIQTLFREAPVVFVVAADRQWLNACYEEVYEKIEPRIHEPGKPLGTLFLEKAFRFSTPMPGMPEELKESYWRHLLHVAPDHRQTGDMTVARQAAMDQVNKAGTESEVRQLVEDSRERSFAEQRALREEAVVRLASPEILERIEHTLKPYARLLEPNPRAMKLLVNGYSANRALTILSEVEIELDQLALWTILSSRWPQLADYLVDHPDALEKIGQPASPAFPDSLKVLCEDTRVMEVIRGDSARPRLTKETLKRCALMRS
jgi:hypothetical protein